MTTINGTTGNDVLNGYGFSSVSAPATPNLVEGALGVVTLIGSNVDDATAAINIGSNTFRFGGQVYTGTEIFASSNGLLTFGFGTSQWFNDELSFNPSIAVLWDDIVTGNGHVLYSLVDTNSDSTPDQLIVEWSNVNYINDNLTSQISFQVILELNTATDVNFTIKYNTISSGTTSGQSNGLSATVGVRLPNTTNLVSYDLGTNPDVQNGRAIQFTPSNAGDDRLNGGEGDDTLIGGAGNDTYVLLTDADAIIELLNEGTDLVQSSVSYTLSANLENLTLKGLENINGTGNALNNTLSGNAGNNVLDGGAGADLMRGGLGNDDYFVDQAGDVVVEGAAAGNDLVQSSINYTLANNVEILILTGTAAINGTGNTLSNTIFGNSGNNIVNGGVGADNLRGGLGNDTYIIDNAGDTVVESLSEGTDLVQSSLSFTLSDNVENLTLTGVAVVNATGNALNNTLSGNTGNNILNGGVGADILRGGLGNDTYVVDNVGDVVTEGLSAGTDLIQSSVTLTLAANVENLTLTGTTSINGTGNTLNNILTGNIGNNILNGGVGIDSMSGGAGNDTYVIDNSDDSVIENVAEGTDLVQSSLSYTLGAHVENLTLTGTTAINGTGNALNNTLTGNAGNNTLNGGTGADSLIGGLGADTYIVDNAGDVVTEVLGAGVDLVQASISYTLTNNVEALTLTGAAAINGTGNTLNNALTGNSGHNTLNGGTGADSLIGGLGNDTYVIDNAGDTVTENASSGTDLVQSSISYTLTTNVEALTLTGAVAINGTGNVLNNTLTGNNWNNTLDGGVGNDTLMGGLGNDTYILNRTSGTDSVVENDATVGNADVLQFAADIRADQIWFRQVGADLEVNIIGTTNKSLIKDWYSGSQAHVEQFVSGDGKVLLDSEVQTLVDAMAALRSTPPATVNLSASQQTTLNPVFAANWS